MLFKSDLFSIMMWIVKSITKR